MGVLVDVSALPYNSPSNLYTVAVDMSPAQPQGSCMIEGKEAKAVLGRDYVSRRHGPRRVPLFALFRYERERSEVAPFAFFLYNKKMESYLDQVLASPACVLATYGPAGLNVVPVSVVTKEGNTLTLYDFFMGKTVANIKATGEVALTAWDGLSGIQIKGQACYESTGDSYTNAVTVMRERFPERTLRGIIRVSPETVFLVSPGTEAGQQLV